MRLLLCYGVLVVFTYLKEMERNDNMVSKLNHIHINEIGGDTN